MNDNIWSSIELYESLNGLFASLNNFFCEKAEALIINSVNKLGKVCNRELYKRSKSAIKHSLDE